MAKMNVKTASVGAGTAKTESKIVAAAGVASTAGNMSRDYTKKLEEAQAAAIEEAYKQGLADQPDKVRAMMAAARQKVKDEYENE